MSVTVRITAVGAFVKRDGDTHYTPAVRGDQVTLSDEDAARLIAEGAVEPVDGHVAVDAEQEQPDRGVIDLENMTIPELRTFANKRRMRGIGSLRTRPEIIEAIEAALTDPDEDGEHDGE